MTGRPGTGRVPARAMVRLRRVALRAGFALGAGLAVIALGANSRWQDAPGAPPTLHETGLYLDRASRVVDPAHLGFAPQYPLWTDGAAKRRWISLPPGTTINAADPDAWDFPVGTRFWKEFAFAGRPVETRYMERRPDGNWLFASYAWRADLSGADLVPAKGRRRAFDFADGTAHAIPSLTDCTACHMSGRVPVLGFGTVQLSDDRDPGALHAEPAPPPALTLRSAHEIGLFRNFDVTLLLAPPRLSTRSGLQRAALGYLHGNCGHCHNPYGPLNRIGLYLQQPADGRRSAAVATTFFQPLASPPPGLTPGTNWRILPGRPDLSAIPQRIASRAPGLQMPPLGTARADAEAVELITRWIAESGIVPAPGQHIAGSLK